MLAAAFALIRAVIGDSDETGPGQFPGIGAGGLFFHAAAGMRHDDRGVGFALVKALGKLITAAMVMAGLLRLVTLILPIFAFLSVEPVGAARSALPVTS